MEPPSDHAPSPLSPASTADDDCADAEAADALSPLPSPEPAKRAAPGLPTALALVEHLDLGDEDEGKAIVTPPLHSTRLESYRAGVHAGNERLARRLQVDGAQGGESTSEAVNVVSRTLSAQRLDDFTWDEIDEEDEDDQEDDYKVFGRETLKAQSSALAQGTWTWTFSRESAPFPVPLTRSPNATPNLPVLAHEGTRKRIAQS